MNKFKKITLLLLCSLVCLQPTKKPNVMPPTLIDQEHQDSNINDPKLRAALDNLNKNFKRAVDNAHAEYNINIKPLQLERDNKISKLKKDYLIARKSLLKEVPLDKEPLKNKISSDKINKLNKVPLKVKGVRSND